MIIKFDNEITGAKIPIFTNGILEYKNDIKRRDVKGILISTEELEVTNSTKRDLSLLIKHLAIVSKQLNIKVAIGEYSLKVYQILKDITRNTSVYIFKNIHIAKLFLNPTVFKGGLKILIYDEERIIGRTLEDELEKYGYTVTLIDSAVELKKLAKTSSNEIIITQTSINQNISKSNSKKLTITKDLIGNIPIFMDNAVETLVTLTGLDAKKNFHTIQPLNIDLPKDIVVAMMSFRGALKGNFMLLFPRSLAILALDSMLGEEIDSGDTEYILDGVGELCNIITGNTKTSLSEKNIDVTFDLPKTFSSMQSANEHMGVGNGILVDMQLENKPFYMFIAS